MTAADMMQAMRLYERMRREELATERLDRAPTPAPAPAATAPPPAAERQEPQNVTPISPQRGRSEAS